MQEIHCAELTRFCNLQNLFRRDLHLVREQASREIKKFGLAARPFGLTRKRVHLRYSYLLSRAVK